MSQSFYDDDEMREPEPQEPLPGGSPYTAEFWEGAGPLEDPEAR